MSSNRTRRVVKELRDIANDTACKVHCSPAPGDNDDLTHLMAHFLGPPDTPYEGGTYVVNINIPTDYPFVPPLMKFKTKLWHPNISSQTGAICLDTIGNAWSPVLNIKSALISLQSLLSQPEPKDPQDAEVAAMLMKDPVGFNHKAREWAIMYAGAPHSTEWTQNAHKRNAKAAAPPNPEVSSKEEEARRLTARYQGYNKDLIDRFVNMGFDLDRVVEAFIHVSIDRNDGQDYELEEAYMGDITAHLLGEP